MLDATDIRKASKTERSKLIKATAKGLTAPTTLGELKTPYLYGNAIRQFIDDYISVSIAENDKRAEGSILTEAQLTIALKERIQSYLLEALETTAKDRRSIKDMKASPQNAYEMAGAGELAFANRVTRNLSTTMGSLWEKLADVSPYAVNPDLQFGIKIRGIDLIAKNIQSSEIEFIQLKTTKNTLSGSQSSRANSELLLHPNPVFAAAFDMNRNWTYNNDVNIKRVCGPEFWTRIGMDYNLVFKIVTDAISQLESEFVKALGL